MFDDNNKYCDRCDNDLTDAVLHHLDSGGPDACNKCGLQFEIDPDWLVDNGYFI